MISQDKVVSFSDLHGASLPTFSGKVQVLSGHAELFTLLREGTVVLSGKDGTTKDVPIKNGGCHFKDDKMVIIL